MIPLTLRSKRGLLIDANILTVYLVGLYDVERIPEFKRTKGAYTISDYYLLCGFIEPFTNRLITTPHILAEVSNLLEGVRYQYGPVLRVLADYTRIAQELYIPSNDTIQQEPELFSRFGLADMIAGELVKQDYLLLTDDLNYSAYLRNRGLSVVNFNNIRFSTYY